MIESINTITSVDAIPPLISKGVNKDDVCTIGLDNYILEFKTVADENLTFGDDGIIITDVNTTYSLINRPDTFYTLTIDGWHHTLKRGAVVSIGSMGSRRAGTYHIHNIDENNNQLIVYNKRTYGEDDVVLSAPIVGDKVYTKHQFGSGFSLGYIFATLGSTAVTGSLRLAIVFGPRNELNSITTWQQAERYSLWTRIYSASLSVTIEFPGLAAKHGGWLPTEQPKDDVLHVGRLMMFNVDLSNDLTGATFQGTYTIHSILDRNDL